MYYKNFRFFGLSIYMYICFDVFLYELLVIYMYLLNDNLFLILMYYFFIVFIINFDLLMNCI